MNFLLNSALLKSNNEWKGKNVYKKNLPCSKLEPKCEYDFINKKYVDKKSEEVLQLSKDYTDLTVGASSVLLTNIINKKTQFVLDFTPIITNINIDLFGNYQLQDNVYSVYTKSTSPRNSNFIYTGFPQQLESLSDSGMGGFTNSIIKSIVFDSDGSMYIGGTFNKIGNTVYNNIVKWDGQEFSSLGSGINGQVTSMCFDSVGNLYVGGSFQNAGSIECNNIAMWDGLTWSALGSGLNAGIAVIIKGPDNLIYVGGSFTKTYDAITTLNYIGVWDGTNWNPLGSEFENNVYALAFDGNEYLYAGGYFITVSKYNINTNTWTELADSNGLTLSQLVNTMIIGPDGNLYLGGTIGTNDSSFPIPNTYNVIKYVFGTQTWVPINNSNNAGLNAQCFSLNFDSDGNLYAGGYFSGLFNTLTGNESLILNYVAKYSLGEWTGLGNGVTGNNVQSIAFSPLDSSVFVGGDFYQAGNKYIYGITNYTNNFINLVWKNKSMGILTNLDPTTVVYTNNKLVKYIGFTQQINNLVSNY